MKSTPRNILLTLFLVLAVALAACAPAATPEPAPVEPAAPAAEEPAAPAAEEPAADPGASMVISGAVNSELTLTTADPAGLEVVTLTAEHPKNGPTEYEGVRLNAALDKAGLADGASAIVITASDDFSAEVALADVAACADCLIGIADGKFNMVMPGLSSKAWVKDVVKIEVTQPAAVVPPANPIMILATTTSTQDSGLLDVLVPMFQDETGYVVQTIAVGTGAALKMGEEGNADVLLAHAPAAEKVLVEAGVVKDRFLVMHNDFVIVGPASDPAGIQGMNVVDAYKAIIDKGASFVTRGDDSGTHKAELALWKKAELDPAAFSPDFYISTGQGMGPSLTIASEREAYTFTDRGTYLALMTNLDLEILVEGDAVLLNVYHVMTVDPAMWPKVNYDGALAFAQFIVREDVQKIIGEFGVDKFGMPLFFPDAGRDPAELGLE
jgi:tungstate transport system substrate-binding protein